MSEFYRPIHVRLQRDNINWRRILDLTEPDGSIKHRLAGSIERDFIIPNHDEWVGIIERWRHLVEPDEQLSNALDEYLSHVVVYKAIRSSGDKSAFPFQVCTWPEAFFPLVSQRIQSLDRELEGLRRKQRSHR